MMQLKDMKTRLNQSMPDSDEELQSAEKFNKVQIKTRKTSLSGAAGAVTFLYILFRTHSV